MALDLTFNTPATSDSGTPLSVAYARIEATLAENEASLLLKVTFYESEAARLAGRKSIKLDEIPTELQNLIEAITPVQYANLDMTTIHNQLAGIFEIGSAHANYPATADQDWLGIQDIDVLNTVVTNMPT